MPSLQQARHAFAPALAAALDQALTSTDAVKPIVLVTAPGGLGKTTATAHLLRHHRVTWFGERNAMQAEVEAALIDPPPGVSPLAGPGPYMPRVEKRIARNDEGACPQINLRLVSVVGVGLGRFTESLACRGCPDAQTCAYKKWKPTGDWLFAPHVRLVLPTSDKHLFSQRDIVVIDENPIRWMLGGVALQPHELDELLPPLASLCQTANPPVAARGLLDLLHHARELLRAPPLGRRRVELRLLARDLGYEFAVDFASLGNMKRGQLLDPELTTVDPRSVAQTIKRLKGVPSELREKLHELADALGADRAVSPACVLVLPDGHFKGGIAAGHFHDLPVPASLPLVVLDATADTLMYDRLFPDRKFVVVDAEVDQVATIYQTTGPRYPALTLADPASPSFDRLMNIVDQYKTDHPGHHVAVLLKKALVALPHIETRLKATVPMDDVHYFWAVRGTNNLNDYDALFIIGAPELNPLEAEARTRAYLTRFPPKSEDRPTYEVLSYFTGEPNRTNPLIEDRGYASTPGYMVWRLLHTDEYIQAILRGRPYDPSKKKDIYFLSSQYIAPLKPIYVSESVLLGEALHVRAERVLLGLRLAGRAGPVAKGELAQMLNVSTSAIYKGMERHPDDWLRVGPLLAS